MNAFPATASEVGAAYANAGLWKDGAAVLVAGRRGGAR